MRSGGRRCGSSGVPGSCRPVPSRPSSRPPISCRVTRSTDPGAPCVQITSSRRGPSAGSAGAAASSSPEASETISCGRPTTSVRRYATNAAGVSAVEHCLPGVPVALLGHQSLKAPVCPRAAAAQGLEVRDLAHVSRPRQGPLDEKEGAVRTRSCRQDQPAARASHCAQRGPVAVTAVDVTRPR